MPSVVITGANRGLGLEFARQYAHDGWEVIATCRDPDTALDLKALAGAQTRLEILRLDVAEPGAPAQLARALGSRALDLLLNNAGTFNDPHAFAARTPRLPGVDQTAWQQVLRVNTLAPLALAEAVLPHLGRGRRRLIASISSQIGSITQASADGCYSYRASKAALNAGMRTLALELAPQGYTVLLLHPGWVRTRMGGAQAPLAVTASVSGLRAVIASASPTQSGAFYDYRALEVPW